MPQTSFFAIFSFKIPIFFSFFSFNHPRTKQLCRNVCIINCRRAKKKLRAEDYDDCGKPVAEKLKGTTWDPAQGNKFRLCGGGLIGISLLGLLGACSSCPAENVFGLGKLSLWTVGTIFSTSIFTLHLLSKRNANFSRMGALLLVSAIFPGAWLVIHQAIYGICPLCLTFWVLVALALFLSRGALSKAERGGVGMAVMSVVVLTLLISTQPPIRDSARTILSNAGCRLHPRKPNSVQGMPPGSPVAPSLIRELGTEAVIVPSCTPCAERALEEMLNHRARIGFPAIPIFVPQEGVSRVNHLKNKGALLRILNPEWLSQLRLTPSSAPHYYRFEEGKVAESLSVGDYVHHLSSSPKGENSGRDEGIRSPRPAPSSPTQKPKPMNTGGTKRITSNSRLFSSSRCARWWW